MHRLHKKKEHDSRSGPANAAPSPAPAAPPRPGPPAGPPVPSAPLARGTCVEPDLQYLCLRVVEAEFASLKTNGAKGVYVQVELEGQEAVTMAKPLKSDCIQWNEELMLSKLRRRSDQEGAKVVVSVLQCFSMSKDKPIFTVEIPLGRIPVINSGLSPPPPGQWYPGGVARPRVFIACWFDQAFERPFRPIMGQVTVCSLSAVMESSAKGAVFALVRCGKAWVKVPRGDNSKLTLAAPLQFDIDDPSTLLTVAFFGDESACVFLGVVRLRTSVLPIGTAFQTTQSLYVRKAVQMGLQTTLETTGQVSLTVRRDHPTVKAVYLSYLQPVLPPMHYSPKYVEFRSVLLKQRTDLMAEFLERAGLPPKATLVLLNADGEQFTVAESRIHLKRLLDVVEKLAMIKQGLMAIIRWESIPCSVLANAVWVWLVYDPLQVFQAGLLCATLLLLWTGRRHGAVVAQSVVMDPTMFKVAEGEHTEDDGESMSDGEGGGEPPDEGFSHLAVSRRPTDMLITKTARILSGGFKTQTLWAYIATFFERILAVIYWQDATATLMVLGVVVVAFLWLTFLPFNVQHALAFLGVYGLRHPRLRKNQPPAVMRFFERLPSRQDRIVPDGVGTKHRLQHIRNLALTKHLH